MSVEISLAEGSMSIRYSHHAQIVREAIWHSLGSMFIVNCFGVDCSCLLEDESGSADICVGPGDQYWKVVGSHGEESSA